MSDAIEEDAEQPPRSAVPPLKVYVTPEERAAIIANALACGLSISAFVRNLALGHVPASILDLREIPNLIAARGDLGRLGGLLKLWLSDDFRYQQEHGEPIHDLLAEINKSHDRLTGIIRRVDRRAG